jgi:hypothetical protein
MSQEKRKEQRRPLDHQCWLDAGPDHPPIACRFLDVSKSGAKIICADPALIPTEFNLYFTRVGKVGRKCIVMWRNGNELGLHLASRNVPKPNWNEPNETTEIT